MHIVGEDLLRTPYKSFCLQFYISNDQSKNTVYEKVYKEFEIVFYMKIIVAIISTNLATNLILTHLCVLS